MTEEVIYIDDPLGRKICFAKNLCRLENEELEPLDLFDDLYTVIRKPAILIETVGSPKEFLYFRSIGWHLSVLIQVRFTAGFWEAYKCTINPSDADIIESLKHGRQLI